MNITKDRLKQIIKEELSRHQVDVAEAHDSDDEDFHSGEQTDLAQMVMALLDEVEDPENWKEHHTMVVSNELRRKFEYVAKWADEVQKELDYKHLKSLEKKP